MRQPFRLLVTGSRTWDDVRTIEQAMAVILDRHPEGVLLVLGACPRGADAIDLRRAAGGGSSCVLAAIGDDDGLRHDYDDGGRADPADALNLAQTEYSASM
jgi:hypothetical protein